MLVSCFGVRFRGGNRRITNQRAAAPPLLAKHRLLIIEIYAFNIAAASVLNNEISGSDSAGDAAVPRGWERARVVGERGTARVETAGTNWPHVCLLSRGE